MDRLKDEKFAEFYKKYLSIIAPNYELLENKRREYLFRYIKRLVFMFLPILILVVIFPLDVIFCIIFTLSALSIIGTAQWYIMFNNKFRIFLKEKLSKKLLLEFGNIDWNVCKKIMISIMLKK